MLQIADLLARFKNLSNTEKAKKELVREVCRNIVGIDIPLDNISFSKNTIFIKTEPIIRTEIFLRKDSILNEIKKVESLSFLTNIQ